MAIPIVSGVYSRYRDLSTIFAGIPGTMACYCFVSDKGVDNKLQFVSSSSVLTDHYGQPNIDKYGGFARGLLNAKNTTNITSIYAMRVLPENATYSNFVVALAKKTDESNYTYVFEQMSFTSEETFDNNFWTIGGTTPETSPAGYDFYLPLAIFYAEGRGDWYNRLKLRITKIINKLGQYNIDLYELKDTGDYEFVDGIIVATDYVTLDDSGNEIYIEDEVNEGMKYIKCKLNPNMPIEQIMSYLEDNGTITDIIVKDITEVEPSSPSVGDIYFISDRPEGSFVGQEGKLATYTVEEEWEFIDLEYGSIFKCTTDGKYYVHYGGGFLDEFNIYLHGMVFEEGEETYSGGEDLKFKEFGNGGEGSMVDQYGKLLSNEATDILVDAYIGNIDSAIVDKENIEFSLLFDCGYPSQVKDAIVFLANLREDCMAFIDNGDHYSPESAVNTRKTQNTYNTRYVALYEGYTEVYVPEFKRNVFVPPSYHLSTMIPRNDRDYYLWFATAGYTRGVVSGIKSLRYNPNIGEREQMKLYQINPIVTTKGETAFMEQRTTLIRPSKFQDIHISRLVMYVDRNLSQIAKYFLFEQNDQFTWSECSTRMMMFLDSLERAFEDKSVSCGASDFEKANRMFSAKISLTPLGVVERILLDYTIR